MSAAITPLLIDEHVCVDSNALPNDACPLDGYGQSFPPSVPRRCPLGRLLFVEDVLRTASTPSSRTLYLVLAPLGFLALVAGQGPSRLLKLTLGYI